MYSTTDKEIDLVPRATQHWKDPTKRTLRWRLVTSDELCGSYASKPDCTITSGLPTIRPDKEGA